MDKTVPARSGVVGSAASGSSDASPRLVSFCVPWPDPKTGDPRSRAGMQSFWIEAGKLARYVRELLASGKTFTAILSANDRRALGAIDELREQGIECPRQVSVTGFNACRSWN
jgi:hypothetical protein